MCKRDLPSHIFIRLVFRNWFPNKLRWVFVYNSESTTFPCQRAQIFFVKFSVEASATNRLFLLDAHNRSRKKKLQEIFSSFRKSRFTFIIIICVCKPFPPFNFCGEILEPFPEWRLVKYNERDRCRIIKVVNSRVSCQSWTSFTLLITINPKSNVMKGSNLLMRTSNGFI